MEELGRIISWWSGGIASAVACKLALNEFSSTHDVELVFIDTFNEHEDTYRFLDDCSNFFGYQIKTIKSDRFDSIQDVWRRYKSLNVAHGAVCSSVLKKEVRTKYQDIENDFAQIFGFDYSGSEQKRARNMLKNYPEINPLFPLIENKYTKEDCINEIRKWGIELPWAYKAGFRNNNCFETGCVQGGIGYWQKMFYEYPEKFEAMAEMEHELSELKGDIVSICSDQTGGNKSRLFLKHNPNFPEIGNIMQKKGRAVESLMECNGFCSTEDQLDLFDITIKEIAKGLQVGKIN